MRYINLEYYPQDSRIKIDDGEVCQTLHARMGTGGNNVPMIIVVNDEAENSNGKEIRRIPRGR